MIYYIVFRKKNRYKSSELLFINPKKIIKDLKLFKKNAETCYLILLILKFFESCLNLIFKFWGTPLN